MRIKPKKSLGQNFLTDRNIQRKIISASSLKEDEVVLEIGSGKGDLTRLIIPRVNRVFALEIDQRLLPFLRGLEDSDPGRCRVIGGDILKFDLDALLRENNVAGKIKVIGNIPYYISSPIIERLIGFRKRISTVYLTVQKEFARRAAAFSGSKEYGSFSCFLRYYAVCRILFEIKRGSFSPVPNVDSSFISLAFRDEPPVKVDDEESFFKLVRTAFNQRRKTLRNSLEGAVDRERLEDFFGRTGIDKNVRPEMLSLEEFAEMYNYLRKK